MHKKLHEFKKSSLISEYNTIFLWQDAQLHSLHKSIINSWFLTTNFLTFYPTCATNKLLISTGTSRVPSFFWWKGLNQNLRWYTQDYTKNLTHVSRSRPISSKWPITQPIYKNLPHLIKNVFRAHFKILSFKTFLPSNPHIIMRVGSWKTSLGYYLEPVRIQTDLTSTNFQWTMIPSSWMTSICVFLIQINLIPSFFRWPWSYPVTLQLLKLHPKISPHQKYPKQSFFFCL